MKEDVKKLWVNALRSGEYKQDICGLRGDKGFCCLGVLTDLYIKQTGQGKWVPDTFGETEGSLFAEGVEREGGVLPRQVMQWAGLVQTNPVVGGLCLSKLNDSGSDFEEIANVIEAKL